MTAAAMAVALALVLGVGLAYDGTHPLSIAAAAAGASAAVWAFSSTSRASARAAVVVGLTLVLHALTTMPWPLPAAVALLVTAPMGTFGLRRSGVAPLSAWLPLSLLAGIGAVAVLVAVAGTQPDITLIVPGGDVPVLRVLVILGAAALNATVEELLWRGVVLGRLLATGWRGSVAVAVSAASFGLAHLSGYPEGLSGLALTTLFGLVTGWLVLRTGALRAAIAAHFVADVAIMWMLIG